MFFKFCVNIVGLVTVGYGSELEKQFLLNSSLIFLDRQHS